MGILDVLDTPHRELRETRCGDWVSRINPATKQRYSVQAFCNEWLTCKQCRERKAVEFEKTINSATYISSVNGHERKNMVRRLGGSDNYRSIPQGDDTYLVFHNSEKEAEVRIDFNADKKRQFAIEVVIRWAKSSGRMSGRLGKEEDDEEDEVETEKVTVRVPVYYKPKQWEEIVDEAYVSTYDLLPTKETLQECLDQLHDAIRVAALSRGVFLDINRWETRHVEIDKIDWRAGRECTLSFKDKREEPEQLPLNDGFDLPYNMDGSVNHRSGYWKQHSFDI